MHGRGWRGNPGKVVGFLYFLPKNDLKLRRTPDVARKRL
jgi:hypothetical protein